MFSNHDQTLELLFHILRETLNDKPEYLYEVQTGTHHVEKGL